MSHHIRSLTARRDPIVAHTFAIGIIVCATLLLAGPARAGDVLVFSGEESGDDVTQGSHIISFGGTSHVPWQGVTDQWRLDQMAAQGARPFLAHPYGSDWPFAYVLGLNNLYGMEIYHGATHDFTQSFDELLAAGKHIRGFGSDDSHGQPTSGGGSYIVAKASALTQPAIIAALDAGAFYASQGAEFTSLGVINRSRRGHVFTQIFARTRTLSTYKVFTARGLVWTAEGANGVYYMPQKTDGYVRIQIETPGGDKASSQAFWVDNKGVPSDPYAGSGQWYKGNLHFHTTGSDGNSTPLEALTWYAEHGYSFISPADHNVVTTDFEAPTVSGVTAAPDTVSPNADGLQDSSTIAYTLGEACTTRVMILDADGNVFRYLTGWLSVDAGPQSAQWDGKYTDGGGDYVAAPDGLYTAVVRAKDALGNTRAVTAPIAVDTTVRSTAVTPAVFSPDGNGAKDIATLSYTLARPATLGIVVLNVGGDAVRVLQAPQAMSAGDASIEWDGRDDSATVVPEGTYRFALASTSEFGVMLAQRTVGVDLTAPAVTAVSADPTVISPYSGGTTITYTTVEPAQTRVSILDGDGVVLRNLSAWTDTEPGDHVDTWDGKYTDGGGDYVVAPDGVYSVVARARDTNGNESQRATPVTVDTGAPSVSGLTATPATISPNADGLLDSMSISFTTDEPATTRVVVLDGDGDLFRYLTGWTAAPAGLQSATWDGKYTDGGGNYVVAPDGAYTIEARVKDAIGNLGTAQTPVAVDTAAPSISGVSADPTTISPNADGLNDSTTVTFTTDEIATTRVAVLDSGANVIRYLTGWVDSNPAGPHTVTWDGKYTDGGGDYVVAPDGVYTMQVRAKDAFGNMRTATTPVNVDLTIQSPTFSPSVFSPNGDGSKDTSSVGAILARAATVTIDIVDGGGATVRHLQAATAMPSGPMAVVWDGRDDSAAVVAEGTYTAVITAVSDLGTTQARRSARVDVTKPTISDWYVSPTAFKPPATTAVWFTTTEAGTATVTFEISSVTVRTITENVTAGANDIVWDGKDAGGTPVAPGIYTVKLNVKDLAANKAQVYPAIMQVSVTP